MNRTFTEASGGEKARAWEPLRVALIHHRDARNVRNWSGTIHFSKKAIATHVGTVVDLSPAPVNLLPFQIARRLIHRTTGKWYSYEHDPSLARWFGHYFSRRVAQVQPDLIFAPAASACVAFLETDVPILYYSDATWRLMQDYHAGLTNVIARTARAGDDLERRSIERSALALFASDWASQSAIRDYGAHSSKVATVFIGANLSSPPRREDVLPRKLGKTIRLFMVGVSWEQKGGPIAFATLLRLLDMGIDAEVCVVGCVPPAGLSHPRLRIVPFLDKSVPKERAQFEGLWKESDLFILPTRFEAAGIVFCEAGAYGLPVVATRTGGTSSLVLDGRNGITLPPEAGGEEYAIAIAELIRRPQEYERLCEGSRREYETRLNWDAWGRRVAELVEERIPGFRNRTLHGARVETAIPIDG